MEERLRAIEVAATQLLTVQQEQGKQLDKIDHTLHGNGSPGMKTRLDRLEQQNARSEKHFWTLWPALIGTAIVAAWEWVKNG